MTSTSTFKGMDSETKPSSRVLAPPGGGSSNIFGSSEPAQPPPKKEVAPPPKPAEPTPVSQSTQGERFVRAAPKQGEDSFQNVFGSEKSLDYRNSSNSGRTSSNHSSPNTFDSLFGHANVESRKASATKKPVDSFNRLFGQQHENKSSNNKLHEDSSKMFKNLSLKNPDTTDSTHSQTQSTGDHDSSFHRVFGGPQEGSTPARSKRHSDSSCAYNPITGQPYDMPEEKKKEPAVAKNEDEEEKAMGKENEQKPDTKTQPPVAAKEKTSTRIAQPPGGKSSGLW